MNYSGGNFTVNGNMVEAKLLADSAVPKSLALNEENNTIFEELAAKIETVPKFNSDKANCSKSSRPSAYFGIEENIQCNDESQIDQKLDAASSNFNSRLNVASAATSFNANRILAPKVVENKILSLWHTVKYGWSSKMRTNFSKVQPVWLLGKCYHNKLVNTNFMSNISQQALRSPSIASDMMISTSLMACAQDQIDEANASDNHGVGEDEDENDEELEEQQTQQHQMPIDISESSGIEVESTSWEDETLNGFRADFFSRLWMTYRREFPLMNNSHFTSDCGWGCMLRSGQMLLAQALLTHFLGRNWRYDAYSQLSNTYEDNVHKKIIKWFGDSNSRGCPFSIHALVELGLKIGKRPGEWYGPASVSILLRDAVKAASSEIADFNNLVVYVAKDSTIYLGDIESKCCVPERTPKQHVPWKRFTESQAGSSWSHSTGYTAQQQQQKNWKSLIILIPVRLGTIKVNPIYSHWLKLLLSSEYCIGIIGGRPKHSLYFVGFQEDKLIYLDPHYCQEVVDVNQENFPLQSFHCDSPRKLKISKMDPCCCVGFYCQTRADFLGFQQSLQPFTEIPASSSLSTSSYSSNINTERREEIASLEQRSCDKHYPLFTFSAGRYLHQNLLGSDTNCGPSTQNLPQSHTSAKKDINEKDFILL